MGVLHGFRTVAPRLVDRGGGALVAVSSIAGRRALPISSTYYTTSKAAVIGLVQSAAFDLGPHNVRVNAIVPGRIETDMTAEAGRSEEHTSELQSLMRISYAVFCLKKQNNYYTILPPDKS